MQPSSLHVCGHGRIYFVFGVWSGPEGKGSNFYPTFARLCFSQCFSSRRRRRSPCERGRLHQSLLTLADCCFCFYYHYNRTSNKHSAKRARKKIHSLHHDHHHHENIHHRAPPGKCACLLLTFCCRCCCALDTKNTQTPFMLLIHHETGQLLFLSHIYAICTTHSTE